MSTLPTLNGKVALITGAARRIGASISRRLHADGANVVVHYRNSADDAVALCEQLNQLRPDSAMAIQAELAETTKLPDLVASATAWHGRLDILINNASSFYPTPIGTISEEHWNDLVGTNLKAPLFLSQAALQPLRESRGSIVNIVDVHAQRPLREHAVYGSAKAGLAMLTRSLAKDLAPEVRVNGVSPGAIMWPENGLNEASKTAILKQIPAGRIGDAADIAGCVLYLVRDAHYVTGQIIAVDGGRSIGW
jgi:pteridine reductase